MPWYYDPQSGGSKIPLHAQCKLRMQVEDFARTRPWHDRFRLIVRFRNQFCYLDEQGMGEGTPSPLSRLRYFSDNSWSLALYTWSHEKYEPCLLCNGEWTGSLELAIETSEVFLI
jgi:hypothetical protein